MLTILGLYGKYCNSAEIALNCNCHFELCVYAFSIFLNIMGCFIDYPHPLAFPFPTSKMAPQSLES